MWNDVNSDQRKREKFSLDSEGHFLVGAAIGCEASEMDRARLLVDAGCRIIVIDGLNGNVGALKQMTVALRKEFGDRIDIIAGNVASYTSALHLLEGEGKPDAIKVGIGGGSTGTTRDKTAHGIPQVTALFEVWKAIRDHGEKNGYYVPIIADGGIRTSGDIVKCYAVGASGIMLGSLMAGTLEAPGVVMEKDGRKYKIIRGMASERAIRGQMEKHIEVGGKEQKEVADMRFGVEGRVLLSGSVESLMTQLLGGVQSGLAHSGSLNIPEFHSRAHVWAQSFAGAAEGKPHDILDVRG